MTQERITSGGTLTPDEEEAMRDNVVNLLAGEVAEARRQGDAYHLDPLKLTNHTRDEKDVDRSPLAC